MASSQSIPEAMQNVLPALDLVIGKRIEALTYDKTVTATIVDASDSSIGKYVVTDGSSTYEAFSDNVNYSKGTVVLVTVVENDYSKQKIIVGRYVTDDSEHFTYVDPMKSFIDITKNIITKNIQTLPASLKANGNITEKTIWSIAGRNFKGYDKLAIKADFKSWLKELGVRAGTYGLRLDITTRTMGTTQTQNSQKLYSVVLNTNDFYGDPYNYETYYTQKKVVDISEMECIESMTLTFYQGNDFRISENELLINPANSANINNLFVNNIYISLGYSLDKFSEDTILLYTLDSATYASYLTDDKKDLIANSLRLEDYNNNYEQLLHAQIMVHNSENEQNKWLKLLNKKNMYCRWIHFVNKEEAVAYESYLDNFTTEGIVVHWYQQVIQEGINDPLAGNYWQEITNKKNKFEYLNFDPDIKSPNQLFKIIIEVPAQEKIAESIYNDQIGNAEVNKKPFENYFKGLYYPIEVKNKSQFATLKQQYGTLYTYNANEIKYDSAANYTAAEKYYRQITNDPRIGSDLPGYSFYDWVMLGITKLEEEIQYFSQRLSQDGLNAEIDVIVAAYDAELTANGLKRSDAAANDITKKYRRLLLDVEQNLNNEISSRRIIIERIQSRLAAGKKYYSAILTFTNEDASPDYSTLELANALQLTVDEDGYKGNYRIYDDDGQIISQKESQKKRIITASWDTLMSGDRNNDKIESITWRIPTKNTMIQKPEEEIEFSAYTEAKDIQTRIDFDNCDRQLYTYNPNTKTYSAVLANSSWQNIKYYYKGFESWSVNEQAGYIEITRLGESFEPHEEGIEWPSSSGQVFRVKDFYTQANSNNTIYCTVRKNNRVYKAQVTLSFGPTGTNGTDYAFELEIEGKVPALTTQLGAGIKDQITIIPHLYNFEGNDIIDTIDAGHIVYEWYSPGPNSGYLNLAKNATSRNAIISVHQAQDDINKCKYHILKASITQAFNINGKQVFLDTYLPIPVRSSIIYTSVDGADRISYDAQGINPKYYKNSYKIYRYDNKTTNQITNQVRWEISYGSGVDGVLTSNQNAEDFKKFYPTLSSDNKLIPASYYIKSNGKQIAINCYISNSLVWTQPLYIYQNSYTSALLNSWDGSLSIDEENGTILSSLMGAGMKDERNRFNGVIMGDVASITSNTSEAIIPLGLYGYNEGVQSFGFKIDGTAFIGKSDRGQITFDGNSGQIASLSRKADSGMLIDLDDGLVDIKGANLSGIQFIDLESSTKTTTVYATVVAALNKQRALLDSQKTKIQQAITNDWVDQIDKLAYQKKSNLIYNQSINAIDAILNEFNTNSTKYDDDWKKWLYIQEIGQTQLLNDEHFKPQYTTSKSRIRISTTNPYFYVQSQNQNKLIYIADDSYYLKTDNFKFPKGEIFKADGKTVKDDILDYYPIKQIYTGNAQTKYTQEFLSEFKESDEYGEGFLFDLQNGYILGYNFKLKGVNNGQEGDAATRAMKDSYFELNSNGDPFLAVHYRNTDDNKINILNNKGLLPYVEDWDGSVVTGTLDQTKTYKNYNVATPTASKRIEKDLIRVSKNEFYLQSWNYIPSRFTKTQIAGTETGVIDPTKTGTGVLLDLTKGALYGHDFTLSMIDTGEDDAHYKGSYVAIGSDGQPYFKIHYQYMPTVSNNPNWNAYDSNGILINKNLDLINIGKGAWMIKSRDYQAPDGELIGRGLYFNLNGDENLTSEVTGSSTRQGSLLTAYSFRMDAYSPGLKNKDYSRRIVLNSAATDQIVTGKTVTSYVPNYDYINAQEDWESVEAQLIADCNSKTDAELEAMTTGSPSKVKKVTKQLYDRPFMIGGLFSVSWKGLVTLDYIKADQGGKIGPFTISSWALYSNNGWLANNESFYASTEPSPYGVYLGRDGLSVRDVFAVYKYAMHPRGSAVGPRGETPNSGDFEEASTDFVVSTTSSPMYTGTRQTRDFKTKADDVLNDYKYNYNQYFTTPKGTSLNLKNLRFFLKGGSVLDGRSVINGNSYIFGRLEVGESKEINLTSEEESPTVNKAIIYADTKIYGILKVTGKTYLGDKNGIWNGTLGVIAKTSNSDRNANEASVKKFGVVIYRNTLISGNVVIGNNLTVGMANTGTTSLTNYTFTAHSQKKDTVITDEDSIFRSYTANSYFYGNVSVAGNFQAGLLDDTSSKSFIYAKTIELGREDYALNAAQQSDLKIYANTKQEGSFEAGRKGTDETGGQPVTLYGGSAGLSLTNKENGSSGAGKGYFKLYASSVYVEGKASVPSINLHVNSTNYINMSGASTDGGIEIKATKGIDINAGSGSFVLNKNGFALKTAGDKAYITGSTSGTLTLGGDIVLTESGQEAVVNGNLKINGNIYANNLNATESGVTMSGSSSGGGTAGGFGSGVSGGFGGGAGGTGLGNWQCVGANFQAINTTFVLDAENQKISWGEGEYIDAAGASAGYAGISLVSSNAVTAKVGNGFFIEVGGSNVFTASSKLISLDVDTVSHKILYFGSASGDGGMGTGSYYIKNDGTASLKELQLKDALKVKELEGYGTGGITVKSKMTMDADLCFGDDTYKISKTGAASLDSVDIGGSTATIKLTSTGDIQGKQLHIQTSGLGGENMLSVGTGGVVIKDEKLSYKFKAAGASRSLEDLKKLAFADSLKKKFKVDLKATKTINLSPTLKTSTSAPSGKNYISLSVSGTSGTTVYGSAWVTDVSIDGTTVKYTVHCSTSTSGYVSGADATDSTIVSGVSGKTAYAYVDSISLSGTSTNYSIDTDVHMTGTTTNAIEFVDDTSSGTLTGGVWSSTAVTTIDDDDIPTKTVTITKST